MAKKIVKVKYFFISILKNGLLYPFLNINFIKILKNNFLDCVLQYPVPVFGCTKKTDTKQNSLK